MSEFCSWRVGQSSFGIPVEKLKSGLKVNQAGLYPHEILAVGLAPKMWVGEIKYRSMWQDQYGISDINRIMSSLMERGFIAEGSAADSISSYTVDELKKILADRGFSINGRKPELISRVLDKVPSEDLDAKISKRRYIITEKGKDAIKDDEYVMFIHSHPVYGFDIYCLNQMLDGDTKNYRERILEYYQKKASEKYDEKEYEQYVSCLGRMADINFSEEKYTDALKLFETIVFWETSGIDLLEEIGIKLLANQWFPFENSLAKASSYVIQRIEMCKDNLGMTDDDFAIYTSNVIQPLTSPFHIFTKEEIADIIVQEVRDDLKALSAIYQSAKERFAENHPDIKFFDRKVDSRFLEHYECAECGTRFRRKTNECPRCGAKTDLTVRYNKDFLSTTEARYLAFMGFLEYTPEDDQEDSKK